MPRLPLILKFTKKKAKHYILVVFFFNLGYSFNNLLLYLTQFASFATCIVTKTTITIAGIRFLGSEVSSDLKCLISRFSRCDILQFNFRFSESFLGVRDGFLFFNFDRVSLSAEKVMEIRQSKGDILK